MSTLPLFVDVDGPPRNGPGRDCGRESLQAKALGVRDAATARGGMCLPGPFPQAPAGPRAGSEEPAPGVVPRAPETLGGVLGPVEGCGVALPSPVSNGSVRTLQRACLACGSAFAQNPRHATEHRYCSPRCRAAHYRASKQPALPGESRVERAFREWLASEDGAAVKAEVVCRARLLKARGFSRYGIAGLWEAIRYDNALALHGEAGAWKLNNSHRAFLARLVMADCPDLAGFFETRDLRGVR